VHWAEDTFWTADTPVIGPALVVPNVLHHERPSAFLEFSYWHSNGQLLKVAAAVVAGAALFGLLTLPVVLFALIGGHANQVHKWAHQPKRKVPRPVRVLQTLGVLQSVTHHNRHHGGARNTSYCTVTPLLNPLLDRLGFWRGLERALATPTNSSRRFDLWGERKAG
jgi:ubiquitin-conjugating enzyme E2 variant